MKNFPKVCKPHWIESSRAFSHCYAITGYGISHVVIIYRVTKRCSLNRPCLSIGLVRNSTKYCPFNMVVFQQMRTDIVQPWSQLLNTIIRESDTAFFWKSSEYFPRKTRMPWRFSDFVSQLNSSLSIHYIMKVNYHKFLIFHDRRLLAK